MPAIKVTVNGIMKLLFKLNHRKAVGPDKVPTHILRDYADEVAPTLETIFQQSLDTGVVPEDRKRKGKCGCSVQERIQTGSFKLLAGAHALWFV